MQPLAALQLLDQTLGAGPSTSATPAAAPAAPSHFRPGLHASSDANPQLSATDPIRAAATAAAGPTMHHPFNPQHPASGLATNAPPPPPAPAPAPAHAPAAGPPEDSDDEPLVFRRRVAAGSDTSDEDAGRVRREDPFITYMVLKKDDQGRMGLHRVRQRLSEALRQLAASWPSFCNHFFSKLWQRQMFHMASDATSQLPHELMTTSDFSEKLALKFRQEAQSMHWETVTISMLVVVVYFMLPGAFCVDCINQLAAF